MRKLVIVVLLLSLFLFPVVFASSEGARVVDSEMKKLTHYAEEYETGNIDCV